MWVLISADAVILWWGFEKRRGAFMEEDLTRKCLQLSGYIIAPPWLAEHPGANWTHVSAWFLPWLFQQSVSKDENVLRQGCPSYGFAHLILVPFMGFAVSPVRGSFVNMIQILASLLSPVRSVVVCLTVTLARMHSCTRISSTWLNLAVPSLLRSSPCGTASNRGVLMELSPSFAYRLPAACPQALGYSF